MLRGENTAVGRINRQVPRLTRVKFSQTEGVSSARPVVRTETEPRRQLVIDIRKGILAVTAHPDDEFMGAGLLRRLYLHGTPTTIMCLTCGPESETGAESPVTTSRKCGPQSFESRAILWEELKNEYDLSAPSRLGSERRWCIRMRLIMHMI